MSAQTEWAAIQAERIDGCGRNCFTERGAALRVAWLNSTYSKPLRPAVAERCGDHWRVNPW